MIPTLLLVGLVLGGLIHDRTTLVRCAIAVMVVALAWGVGVGVAAGAVSTFAGGTAIALANLTTAALVSAFVRTGVRWFAGRDAATSL